MIRVGRRIYNKNGSFKDPSYEEFTNVLCLTASSEYGEIGPYLLKNDQDQIMENIWQFSKVYKNVPETKEYYSRYNKKIIWEYPAENHVNDGKVNEKYWVWRKKGMNNDEPVRHPVGFKNKNN